MREIIKEYGSVLLSLVATICFLLLVGFVLVAKDSLMAEFIIFWCGGGL